MSAPHYPRNYGWQPGYPPPPPPKKKASKILLLLPLVVVLLAGGIAAVIVLKKPSADVAAQSTPRLDDSPLERVLSQKIVEGPLNYGDTPAFDACAVLPASALEEIGIPLHTNARLERNYIPESVAPENTVKNEFDSFTTCSYDVPGTAAFDRGAIRLEIHQSPYSRWTLPNGPRPGQTETTIAGLRVLTNKFENDSFHVDLDAPKVKFSGLIVANDLAADYNGLDRDSAFAKVVDMVANNLTKGPTGHAEFTLGGRYQHVANACDVLSSEVFAKVSNIKQSGIATHVSFPNERKITSRSSDDFTVLAEQECARSSLEKVTGTSGKELRIKVETYRDETMAKIAERNDCDPESEVRKLLGAPLKVDEQVGDGATCVVDIGSPNFVFRIGRTQVLLTANSAWVGRSLDSAATELAPVAKVIADEVRQKVK